MHTPTRTDTADTRKATRSKIDGPKHPAKFSGVVIEKIREVLDNLTAEEEYEPTVLDPFAGTGGIHKLRWPDANGDRYWTLAVEIEPEWVAQAKLHGPSICCDFFEFEWDREQHWGGPDFVVTSCTYGNRFADKHNARDGSVRRSYKHDLGRDLTPGNSGGMQWGKEYRRFHRRAWQRVFGVLDSGGYLVLNVSDHVRGRKIMKVADWHLEVLMDLGFEMVQEHEISTPRMRMGANAGLRVEYEKLFVVKKS